MDGNFISGTWFNPKTGDKFTVKTTYFENNELVVIDTNGRRLNSAIIQEYIHADDNGTDFDNTPTNQLPASFPPQSSQESIEEYIQEPLQNLYKQDSSDVDEDSLLIRRLLKNATAPEISCNISWKDFPSKQLEMLEMMGVNTQKIIQYFINKLDTDEIKSCLSRSLNDFIKDSSKDSSKGSSKKKQIKIS